MWPAYLALTLLDALILLALPNGLLAPDGFVPAMLMAGFANLFIVAVLAPLIGSRLRRRRGDLPKVVATDVAGTILLVAGTGVVLATGLAYRPVVLDEERDRRAQDAAVVTYVQREAPVEYQAGIHAADVMRVSEDLYRTCLPGPDPKRFLCLFVDTSIAPANVRRDPDGAPNATFRRHGGFD